MILSSLLLVVNDEPSKHKITLLFELYNGYMFAEAQSILKNRASSEDAVSESFIKIIKNLHKLDDVHSPKTKGYLIITARNTALKMLKKQKRQNESPLEVYEKVVAVNGNLLDDYLSKENLEMVVNHIMSLNKTLSDPLYLNLVYGYEYETISEILGISKDAVKMRISRAKSALRSILEKNK